MAKLVKSFEVTPTLEFSSKPDTAPAWPTKIAYYLAHCVDGGLLCGQFTLSTLIRLLGNVTETRDEQLLKNEILYLLNVRKKGQRHERN